MSDIANKVLSILNTIFPANPHRRVFPEHFVNFKGTRLFFDFYVKEISFFFECQGRQHYKFVKHFHKNISSFNGQKERDNLKIEYVQQNGMYLVRLYDYEDITRDLVLNKINKAWESEYNYSD